MAQEVSTLSAFRIGKLTERVAMLERALIEERAAKEYLTVEVGALGAVARRAGEYWHKIEMHEQQHYRTLAENELVREGLVRPKNVREMEVRGNGQKEG